MDISTPSIKRAQLANSASVATWRMRWRVARLIARQEILDALYSWPFYVTTALALLLGTLFVYNSLNFVGESGLLILNRPFYIPLLIVASLGTLYLSAWATLAIARPRDLGSLRVLFFAPVDGIGLIGGHLLAGTVLAALLVVIAMPLLVALALMTNLPLSPQLLLGLLLSPLWSALAVAIGLFLSAGSASSRSAIFLGGAALLVVLVIPAGYTAMLGIPPASRYYDALLFLRTILRLLRDVLNWISPFALLSAGLDAALRSSWGELLRSLLVSIVGTIIWGGLAVWGLQRRGVLP